MGGQGSTLGAVLGTVEAAPVELERVDFLNELQKACTQDDISRYRELWEQSWPFRKKRIDEGDEEYDNDLIGADVLKWVRFGFRHQEAVWRIEGIKAGRTFLYIEKARHKLVKMDYLGSLSLISMHDQGSGGDGLEAKPGEDKEKLGKTREAEKNLLAVEIICEMADYKEFVGLICETSVLNFLCIVLNQVPEAAETVTGVFVKLSDTEKNLVILVEASVGDILESFFKTCKYKRPAGGEALLERWTKDIKALGNCARTLGTMIKYGHQCQVETKSIISVFQPFLMGRQSEDCPDCLGLLADLSRLFYWICRSSASLFEKLYEHMSGEEDADFVLKVLAKMWARCVDNYTMLQNADKARHSFGGTSEPFERFCTDDLDRSVKLAPESPELAAKSYSARMLLCYVNCLLWLCLPVPTLRWKLRDAGFKKLHLTFELRDDELLRVTLSTVRHLADMPEAQQCQELIRFFGENLLGLLNLYLQDKLPESQLRLLLDALSILSMQRGMQELLAERDVWGSFRGLFEKLEKPSPVRTPQEMKKVNLVCLFTMAEVAIHPSNRLSWVSKNGDPSSFYPPREGFEPYLEGLVQDQDDNLRTIASLLLTLFQESKFHFPAVEIESTFRSVLEWWQVNTTAQYEEQRDLEESQRDEETAARRPLPELLQLAIARKQQQIALTSMETMRYCAPHESVLALSLLSRLALEPKFKGLFRRAVEPLLGCVCAGIWPEAREAAATLANLMWLPDWKEEKLVCWLKLDGPNCIAVDAANCLLPVKTGNPKPVDMGKGMYKSMWGIEFVEGSCITLHPDGLNTTQIPGTLTAAPTLDTLACTSKKPYAWLGNEPDSKHFTITCWFYWPANPTTGEKVLIQTSPKPKSPPIASLMIECEEKGDQREWVWILVDRNDVQRVIRTPKLMQGWHSMAVVSSTRAHPKHPFDGTKFFLDEWSVSLKHVWMPNDFHVIGNFSGTYEDGAEGKKPFGLISDFRIYASTLGDSAIKAIAQSSDTESHPDEIVRTLAQMDAATILAQRLDVPDSAAECLRALGSLATLASQRAKIYSVCGRELLRMLDSPHPMIKRQAARLMTNMA